MKKSKYDRILSIYTLLQAGGTVEKTALASAFDVNERTVQRDIDDLRAFFADNTLGLGNGQTVVYDRKSRSFRLDSPSQTELDRGELLAVCKILLESRTLTKAAMRRILGKLLQCCAPQNHRTELRALIDNELFHYIEPKHGVDFVDALWDLGNAIREQHYVRIEYTRLKDRQTVRRRVKPVGLMVSECYFYLAAFLEIDRNVHFEDPKDPFPTIYRLDRIQNYQVEQARFHQMYADRFEEGEFRKRVLFMYSGPLHRVRFTYRGASLEAILDRIPTARVLSEQDGCVLLEAEAYGKGIEMWLRTQGEDITIMEGGTTTP